MLQRSTKVNPAKTPTELYFEQLLRVSDELADREWQIRKAAAQAYGLASPSGFSNSRVQFSSGPDAVFVRKLEKRDHLSDRLSARIRLLRSLVRQASGLIDQYTSGRERKVLTLRYLKGYEWLQIAEEVDGLSPKQLRRIARKGLEKILLPEDAIWILHHNTAA